MPTKIMHSSLHFVKKKVKAIKIHTSSTKSERAIERMQF